MSKLQKHSNFEIEDLGIQEIDVYDIEVENDHNFFANDILVHNSCYLNLGPLVDKMFPDQSNVGNIIDTLDKIFKSHIQPEINSAFEQLAAHMHVYAQKMDMKREIIADSGIWTGKKHYVLNVWDVEGVRYDEPKIKMVGIEAVKSSTPNAARKRIKDAIKIILNNDEEDLHKFVAEVRKEFDTLPIDEIAFPRGANNIEQFTSNAQLIKTKTPIAVKAAIYHNKLLKDLNITLYETIKSGSKIKFVYLKPYNPYNYKVMGFANILPTEFELDEHVDRKLQFEKGFLSAVSSITNVIGWQAKATPNLKQYFIERI